MHNIRYLTAGESHGQALVGILEGIPAGLEIDEEAINTHLRRRQSGYGRGGRMKIEKDKVQILSGVRLGKTLGSPIALMIENRDWENWQHRMSVAEKALRPEAVTVPRPGHADLAGGIKYGHDDFRNVLERASARETAIRVALGAVTRKLLTTFNIEICSHVVQIKDIRSPYSFISCASGINSAFPFDMAEIETRADNSHVRCLCAQTEKRMLAAIDEASQNGDSLGGIFEIMALNVPVGLGSHVHWDRRLDGRIAGAMMSIPAIKAVEIGLGLATASHPGSEIHDAIYYNAEQQFFRKTNNAGGLEGGITNGEPLVIRCAMKPIPTLVKPLDSVNIKTHQATEAHKERSDTCAVPAASIVGEAVLSLVLADAFCEKFGGDSIQELKHNFAQFKKLSDFS